MAKKSVKQDPFAMPEPEPETNALPRSIAVMWNKRSTDGMIGSKAKTVLASIIGDGEKVKKAMTAYQKCVPLLSALDKTSQRGIALALASDYKLDVILAAAKKHAENPIKIFAKGGLSQADKLRIDFLKRTVGTEQAGLFESLLLNAKKNVTVKGKKKEQTAE